MTIFVRASIAIWYREMLRFWRDKARVASTFVFPLIALFILGYGVAPLVSEWAALGGVSYISFIFPGVIGMNIIMTSIMMGTSVVWDREFGFLRGAQVAPVGGLAVLIGKILGGSTIASVQGLLLLVFTRWAGIQLSLPLVAALIGLALLISLAMTGMGIAVALCIRSVEGYHSIMQFAGIAMVFLGGAFFPVQDVPTWMIWLAIINPASYAIDLLRHITLQFQGGEVVALNSLVLLGHVPSVVEELLVITLIGLVTLMVSALLFSHR